MKTAALIFITGVMLLSANAQEIRLGPGRSHSDPWNRHTMRVPRSHFQAAGKSLREIFPLELFGHEIVVTYSFSKEVNQEQLRPKLLDFTANFLAAESTLKFLPTHESKLLASENDLLIDCRVEMDFHFPDRRHFTALIDSGKRLAFVNYSGGSGLIRF